MCGDYLAIHVVLHDTEGKYGGVMSHVRVWNPVVQRQVPVCRQCCQDQMQLLGQSVQYTQGRDHPRQSAPTPWQVGQQRWLNWLRQLLIGGQRTVQRLFLSRRHTR
jgi:hypothetical protein